MAFDGFSVLAVVPARGGSKGIHRKNLCRVAGRTLIAHAASVIAALPELAAAVLSSDDAEIIAEAERCGLPAPFVRPAELSDDTSSSVDMWRHAWLAAETHYATTFDISILLEPTSPMRTPDDVRRTLDAVIRGGRAAAATVSPTPAHHAPQKTLTVDGSGTLGYFDPANRTARRQDIPPYFHRNGLCYAVRRATLVERGSILDEDCAAVVVERPVVNIDEPFDLDLAEFLFAREQRTARP